MLGLRDQQQRRLPLSSLSTTELVKVRSTLARALSVEDVNELGRTTGQAERLRTGMPPARGSVKLDDDALGWPVHRLKGEVAYPHNGSGTGFGVYVYVAKALTTGGMIFVTGQPAPQDLFPRLEQSIGLMVDASTGL
jgi:hypothetical protein